MEDVLALKGFLSVEPPSANLHNFQGRIHYTARTSLFAVEDGVQSMSYMPLCATAVVHCVLWRAGVDRLLTHHCMRALTEQGVEGGGVDRLLTCGNGVDGLPTGGGSEQENLLTMDDVLLRGCMLKNSHFVIGVVMYTGPESRIQKNASATPIKVGTCYWSFYLHQCTQ